MKYSIIDGVCITPCPYGVHKGQWLIKVASTSCRQCRYFRGINGHSVGCARRPKAVESRKPAPNIAMPKCPHCGKDIVVAVTSA